MCRSCINYLAGAWRLFLTLLPQSVSNLHDFFVLLLLVYINYMKSLTLLLIYIITIIFIYLTWGRAPQSSSGQGSQMDSRGYSLQREASLFRLRFISNFKPIYISRFKNPFMLFAFVKNLCDFQTSRRSHHVRKEPRAALHKTFATEEKDLTFKLQGEIICSLR